MPERPDLNALRRLHEAGKLEPEAKVEAAPKVEAKAAPEAAPKAASLPKLL